MKLASFLLSAILIGLILIPSAGAGAEEISIYGDIPSDIRQIDLTYSDAGPPRLSFQFQVPPPARPTLSPFRPSTAQFDVLSVVKAAKLAGSCGATDVQQPGLWAVLVRADRAPPCEVAITVQTSTAIDVLSYATVALKGHTAKPVTFALAHDLDQPAVPLVTVTGHFDIRVALKPIIARLDPTRITTIIFEAKAGETTLTIERFLLERTSTLSTTGPRTGFWVWDYRAAVTDPEALIEDCRRAGVTRILVQMPDKNDPTALWSAYARLLDRAASSGLEAFALDGYPEATYDPTPLMEKISRLRLLLPQGHMNGVQLDIEPYLLAQFSDPQDYSLYLRAIEKIKASVGDHATLSIVMPFWFSAKTVHHRPLDFELMD
jgi:hypothetical protein